MALPISLFGPPDIDTIYLKRKLQKKWKDESEHFFQPKCENAELNVQVDHVHLFVQMSPKVSVAVSCMPVIEQESRQPGNRCRCAVGQGKGCRDKPTESTWRCITNCRHATPCASRMRFRQDQLQARTGNCHTRPNTTPRHCRAYHTIPRHWPVSGPPDAFLHTSGLPMNLHHHIQGM